MNVTLPANTRIKATLFLGVRYLGIDGLTDCLSAGNTYAGAGAEQLGSGPGDVRVTALPGQVGNAVIVGLDDRFGGPFCDLGAVVK